MKTSGIALSVFCIFYSIIFNIIYPVRIYTLFGGSMDVGVLGEQYLPRLTSVLESWSLEFLNPNTFDKFLGFGVLLSSILGSIIIFIPEERIGEKKFMIAIICGVVLLSILIFSFYIINFYGPNIDLIQED